MQDTDAGRDALLDAAWTLWAEHGWAAVTLPAVAASAGLDETALREQYPADVDLLCAVFDLGSEIRGAAALAALDALGPGASGAQRWRAVIESYVRLLDQDPRHIVAVIEAIGSPALQARRRSAIRGFAAVVAEESTRATRSGAQPDRLAAAHFCIGGLTELILAWQDPNTDVDRDAVLQHGSDLYQLVMSDP